ncbi:MAG: VWA domain-containing protein [Acidobacteria bacterium]|nr:VWA domain-containing protein [Acidobacteriota bacterium]
MIGRTKRRTRLLFLLGLLSVRTLVTAQTPAQLAPAESPPPEDPATTASLDAPYRFAVEVDVVSIRATVLDERGRFRDDLKAEDFRVFENGQEQKLSFFSHEPRVPVSVGIMVDSSGSMRFKIQHALQTVREIALALWPQDEMFLLNFDSDIEIRHRFTSDAEKIQRPLREIKAGGETAMYDAIGKGMQEMKAARHNKKILLLITDGFDTKSRITSSQAEEMLKRSDVLLYAIGIDDDDNDPAARHRTKYHIYHHAFNRLTGISGGRAFRMFTGRTAGIQVIARQLVEELHQQYTLGYYPVSRRGGDDWRQVEVKMSLPASQIWYRPGYYADRTSGQSR